MPTRSAHLVGSLPGADPEIAMAQAFDLLGPHLRSLPDGETGERRNWIISIVEALRDHPALELRKAGDWSDYDKTPTMRVRRGARLFGASIDLGYATAAQISYPPFESLRRRSALPGLTFQAGLPGDFDLATFTLGPLGALRHRRAFTEATLMEIRDLRAATGGDTLFQIEVPVELVLLTKAPPQARPLLAKILARNITGLAAGAPEGTRFGVHLCLGDMNHRAFGTMTDVSPLVLLANAVVAGWPPGRPLDTLHAPFAAAEEPATTSPQFYAPLAHLRLPADVVFAAGFAHEEQLLSDQRAIRSQIEELLGRQVAISAACGLGRRGPGEALAVLERHAELCRD